MISCIESMHRFNFGGALKLLQRSVKLDHIGADKMGQLAPDIMGTSKPESLDHCDRILHSIFLFLCPQSLTQTRHLLKEIACCTGYV